MPYKDGEQIKTIHGLVYCSITNNLQDRTIVFIHGNSSSGRFWNRITDGRLQQHFNFLLIDLPGHGQSPIPKNPQETYSLPAYAGILAEIIDYFELRNFCLFGHSLGGHVILESPDKLEKSKGAIIMGTPPLTIPPLLEKAFLMSPEFLSFLQSGSDKKVMEKTFRSMMPEEQGDLAELLLEDYFRTDPHARALLTQSISEGKLVDEIKVLQQTHVPVYVVTAENDRMVNNEYFTQFVSGKEVVKISASGHYAPLEKPEAFTDLIIEKFTG